MHYVSAFDYYFMHFINQFAGKSRAIDLFIFDIAGASILEGGLFMTYFWWLWFRADRDAEARRRLVLTSVVGAVLAVLVSRILQLGLPYHHRPLDTPDLGFVLPYGVNPKSLSNWSSLPSDHAVLFFALSVAVWCQKRWLGYLAMAWTLLVICLPRVYLGYHYPSDIVAGAIVGIALMIAAHGFMARAGWVARVVRWEANHRAIFYCLAFVLTYELAVLFYDVRQLTVDSFHVLNLIVPHA